MTPPEAAPIVGAGMAAGTINTIVGSGSLITFPTLLAFGYPPVVANVSNTIGLVPGSISGTIGYRRELGGQAGRIVRLGTAAVLGGLFVALAIEVWRKRRGTAAQSAARRLFAFSVLYLFLLFVALLVEGMR